MTLKHIIKRGAHFHYVRRVPIDLASFFPAPVISRSLHTNDKKYATILVAAWEYRTHQLFMQLRSSMLDPFLIEHLITRYLKAGLDHLDAKAYGRDYKPGEISTGLDVIPSKIKLPLDCFAEDSIRFAEQARKAISAGDICLGEMIVNDVLAPIAKSEYGVKLDKATKHELAVKALQTERLLAQAQSAVINGDLEIMDLLRDKINKTKPYLDLARVIKRYDEKYRTDKGQLGPRADKHLTVELDVILEIFGNVSIDIVNSRDGIVFCKDVLRRYPLNRVQRFDKKPKGWVVGDKPYKRSIHHILKHEHDYDKIDPQTANAYIKRINALVKYAIKHEDYNQPNRWEGELFDVDNSEDSKRSAYDQEDIDKLISALCEKPLWRYRKEPKPERFWLVLIALLHGFRLGNIVSITKDDILKIKGVLGFQVRVGKTKHTRKFYPMNDCLQLLGFMEWVWSLDRNKLFQDSANQASKWFNRVDRDEEGNITWAGFEYANVTQDPSKCLHSLRHSYGGEVYAITDDIKATAEMMGHAPPVGKVTNRYIGVARIPARKAILDKLNFDIDLDKLEAFVKNTFNIEPPTYIEE